MTFRRCDRRYIDSTLLIALHCELYSASEFVLINLICQKSMYSCSSFFHFDRAFLLPKLAAFDCATLYADMILCWPTRLIIISLFCYCNDDCYSCAVCSHHLIIFLASISNRDSLSWLDSIDSILSSDCLVSRLAAVTSSLFALRPKIDA